MSDDIRHDGSALQAEGQCQPALDSVLARSGHPVQQWGTATRARYGCSEQASTHALACYEQVYDIDEITTRMPTPDEIARLGLPAGTPVAEHIRTGYTADNKPVRLMVSIVPGDTLILQYTVPT